MAEPFDSQLRPSADEVCVAILFGQLDGMKALSEPGARPRTPREAVEELLRTAFQRGPVWISFSGGRDSSALLAIAAAVARREGFSLPVPITNVFPAVGESDEESWQRLVLDYLGLTERWVRVASGADLDMLGPYAQRVLERHGLLLPPNAHGFLPLLDRMGAGGTLVTGSGGDELLEGTVQRISSALLSLRPVPRAELRQSVVNDFPKSVRARGVRRHSLMASMHWVAPAARERLLRHEMADRLEFPVRFDRLLERAWTDRHFQMTRFASDLIARDTGTTVLSPFVERDVVAAMAQFWGYRYPGKRLHSLERLVGDLLPRALLERTSKAEFGNVFMTERSREFVADWDGSGIDPERVSVDRLRWEWSRDEPHYCSLPLLQQAWIAGRSTT